MDEKLVKRLLRLDVVLGEAGYEIEFPLFQFYRLAPVMNFCSRRFLLIEFPVWDQAVFLSPRPNFLLIAAEQDPDRIAGFRIWVTN